MSYVDGFLVPVKAADRAAYRAVAARTAELFREHGAIRVVECWGDDVPTGEVTDFPRSVRAGDEEVVVFSWIEWPSKAVRDEANPKLMADPRMQVEMPFDTKRLVFGGFETILDA